MGAARKMERKLELELRDLDEPFIDERRHDRKNVYGSIDIFSEHNFWTGLTMNMSEGGVFVATHKLLAVGAMVVVNLSLPGGETITTLGQVRWTREYSETNDASPGLGIQFMNLDARMLAAIRRFVANVREPILFED